MTSAFSHILTPSYTLPRCKDATRRRVMTTTHTKLVERFGAVAADSKIQQSLLETSKLFALSIDELFVQWESFVIGRSDNMELCVDNLVKLQDHIQSSLTKRAASSLKSTPLSVRKPLIRANISSPLNSSPVGIASTPQRMAVKKRKLETPSSRLHLNESSPISSPQISPSKKIDSGKVIESLNGHLNFDSASCENVSVVANFDPAKYQYRTMRQKILEDADVMDDQLDRMTGVLQKHLQLEDSDIGNPCIPSQSSIVTVGRIVPDSPLAPCDVALNSASLFLETSRALGIGQRVPLQLDKVPSYSLFPGQVVALRGTNPNGEFFIVDEMLEFPLLGAPVSTEEELLSSKGVKTVVCCGPYTTQNDFSLDPLNDLVDRINNEIKPNSVILFGPFVDISHPLVATGTVDVEGVKVLDDIFKSTFAPILKNINPETQIILVPSLRDVNTKHAAYPQDSLDKKGLQLPFKRNFKNFPNPATFQLNEILVGCSNNDVFKDLKEVTQGEAALANRFDRIVSHMLDQRRYYPCFPGGVSKRRIFSADQTVGANIDLPYMGLSEFSNDATPDLMIIPSELKHFARCVKNVVVLNPGTFMKSNSPGTYAVVQIAPSALDDEFKVDENLFVNGAWKRTRVDIVKV